MEADPLSSLADGWETVLLAAMHRNQAASGITRTNKQLAILQMEGFPIPFQFEIWKMGPASKMVGARAMAAVEQGLLKLVEEPMSAGYHSKRSYRLTLAGQSYFQDRILPAIQARPDASQLIRVIQRVAKLPEFARDGNTLVQHTHDILHLDDADEYLDSYAETSATLQDHLDRAQTWNVRDEANLTAAAAIDLAASALEAIQPQINNIWDRGAGACFVLWNAEQVRQLADQKQALESQGLMAAPGMAEDFEARIFALENLLRQYDIMPLTDDDVLDLMRGVSASHPFQEA